MKFKQLPVSLLGLLLAASLLAACAPAAQQAKETPPAQEQPTAEDTAAAERAAAERAAAEAAAREAAAKAAAEKAAMTPMISSISPTKGRQGSRITVNGEKFGANPIVRFDTTPAKILSASSTQIAVLVPSGLSIGKHTVTVESNGYISNGVEYIDP